jgi:hypothetical protein
MSQLLRRNECGARHMALYIYVGAYLRLRAGFMDSVTRSHTSLVVYPVLYQEGTEGQVAG